MRLTNMYMKRIINKVPGNVESESKKEKQGYIGDLSKKTVVQLNELLQRQCKLLSNKLYCLHSEDGLRAKPVMYYYQKMNKGVFIKNLPDKGEKIMKLKEALEEELKKRNDSADISKMLSALSVNGKEDLDALEWTGQCIPGQFVRQEETNDSDEEHNPFKILATHSGAGFHKKKLKELKPEQPLIKPLDIVADEPVKEELEEFAKHLCEKFDASNTTDQGKTKFLPHRTLNSASAGQKKVGKHWEVTAATPPPPIHGDTKLVSLHESIRLQMEQQSKLKDIQIKHAMERLGAWQGEGFGKLPQNVGSYREPASCSTSDDEGSEHEVHDEEYPDGGGVIVYNLVDDTND